ncbi:MAG: hypothetical protein V4723_07495 [Pseudomonadota bacterium]
MTPAIGQKLTFRKTRKGARSAHITHGLGMLHYLRWLSIAGVWLPAALMGISFCIVWAVGTFAPSAGWGIVFIGMALTFFLSHGLAISSLVGLGLVVSRQAKKPAFTLLTAIAGAILSALVLSRIYFDVQLVALK